MENQIKPIANATTTLPQIIDPKDQQTMVKIWTGDLDKLTKMQDFKLTPTERNFAVSIIYGLVDKCTKDKIDTKKLNMTNFLEQVKHFGKMQLSLQEKELYIDIRNNGKTNLLDVTISKQYQAIQKIMTRYSTKKIVRYVDGIVCKGDTFTTAVDFNTGLTKITNHIKTEQIDRSDLRNIDKAYAIAYVNELGTIVPYVKIIDKKRIMTAYNCSPSKEKTVWNAHTERMVIKTAYWCLYNDVMKPFVEIPSDMQESFAATEDEMNFENANTTEDAANDDIYDIPNEPVDVQQVSEEDNDFVSYLDKQEEKNEQVVESNGVDPDAKIQCAICGKEISDKVATYSIDKLGKPLCYNCQRAN